MKSEHEQVRIRFKKISGGRKSIYLDIYNNGIRRYEFLKLYLLPDTTRANKEKNKEALRLANAVKAKRIVELQDLRFGLTRTDHSKARLFPYIEKLIEERKKRDTSGNARNWKGFLNHLRLYERRKSFLIVEISAEWLKGFQRYLDKATNLKTHYTLSQNTKSSYYKKMKAVINQAVKDGIILRSPAMSVESIKDEESERMYLTLDEVRQIATHDCGRHNHIRDAFVFSCLTGLRSSDIRNLKWGDIADNGDGSEIIFRQKKTHNVEYLCISSQAREIIGERRDDKEAVFHLPSQSHLNYVISMIVYECEIRKHITFHCARHTFATMMLTYGNDLYTTSKLLGHRNVKTTQIYARIIDEKKRKAVESIPDIKNAESSITD